MFKWLDKRRENDFKNKLTYTNLYLLYWQYICDIIEPTLIPMPLDLIIEINLKDKLPKNFVSKEYFEINDINFIKEFVSDGGIILFIGDKHLYKKVKKIEKKRLKYIITENVEESEYEK